MLVSSLSALTVDKTRIEVLVQKCLDAQVENVAAYEAEIGAIAPRLYDLTDAEGAIIEGQAGSIN